MGVAGEIPLLNPAAPQPELEEADASCCASTGHRLRSGLESRRMSPLGWAMIAVCGSGGPTNSFKWDAIAPITSWERRWEAPGGFTGLCDQFFVTGDRGVQALFFPFQKLLLAMEQVAHGSQLLWIVSSHVCSAPHPLPYRLLQSNHSKVTDFKASAWLHHISHNAFPTR